MEFRQPITVRCNQIIDQRPDLIEIKFSCGVRIKHRGVVDMLTLLGEGSLYCQGLNIYIGLYQGCQMWGKRTNFGAGLV